MQKRRNVTTACKACNGRGWHDKGRSHVTIESVMPHGELSYMCASCHGTGQRLSSRRLVVMRPNRNDIWRIYRTAAQRSWALKDIRTANGGSLAYVNDWVDVNGYGLHVIRNPEAWGPSGKDNQQ